MTFEEWMDTHFSTISELYRDFLDETGGDNPKPEFPVAGLLQFAHGLYLEPNPHKPNQEKK